MFLIRPPPFDGESLSSWRQRAGQLNGYWRYPLLDYRSRKIDPDRIFTSRDLDWLVDQFRYDQGVLKPLTLDVEVARHLAKQRFLNQLRGTLSFSAFGSHVGGSPMYCPACLASDPYPFFRVSWRIAFNTRCPVHGCLLRDSCPNCGHRPWPATHYCAEPRRWISHRYCRACGYDLGDLEVMPFTEQSSRAQRIQDGLPHEYGQALWYVSQLFLRNSTHDMLRRVQAVRGQPCDALPSNTRRFEHLTIGHRESLLDSAEWLIEEWPTRFIQVAMDCNLNLKSFASTLHLAPSWILLAAVENLAKRKRASAPWRIGLAGNGRHTCCTTPDSTQ
ncbi:TniQ family protein [Pseudoduganella sp.]|uniref:TniQ family protein n=1 Tax=Pseudoduganella sp. TaxID=1880898 RepID=UPI0035B1D083